MPEPGTAVINHLFDRLSGARMVCLMLGAAEVASVIVRRHNERRITAQTFSYAMDALADEVIRSRSVTRLPIANDTVEAALPFLEQHSVNATDAVLLKTALDLRVGFRSLGDDMLLVASDERLLKAARAEGLPTFDPGTQTEADLDAILAAP